MHFHVFGALAFLLLYQEWRIIPVGAVYVALHHLVGNYLQAYNCTIGEIPIYVFNYGTGLDIVLIHAFFVIFESIILVYISIFLKNINTENQSQIKTLETYRINTQKLAKDLHSISSNLKQKMDNFSSEIENSKKIIYNSIKKVGTISQITSSFQKATEEILKTSEHQIKTFAHLKLQNSESFESLENYIQDQSKINQSIRNSIENLEKGFENFVTLKQITERVSKQSNEMTQISNLISDIADRVNLLSLNASIEAARAGEWGRGFSVVAQEISKLSDLTTNSTKNISQISHSIIRSISDSEKIINKIYHLVSKLKEDFVSINDNLNQATSSLNSTKENFLSQNSNLENLEKLTASLQSQTSEQVRKIYELNELNNIAQVVFSRVEELTEKSEFFKESLKDILDRLENLTNFSK